MPTDPKQIRTKLITMARAYVKNGDLGGALRHYTRLTGLEPKNASFQIKLGDLALKLERKTQARSAFLAGATLFRRGAFEDKEIAVYRRVLEFAPLDLEVYELLTNAYQRADRTQEAIVMLRAAAAEPRDDEFRKEVMQLRRMIAALDPTNVVMRLQLAHELASALMCQEAVFEYVECILESAVQGDWDRVPSIFESLLALRPEESAEDEDEDEIGFDQAGKFFERIFTNRRYQTAVRDMYRRMSELGREQVRTLELQ